MAFAKMQTPQSLRESYLLTDADFETIREGEDASVEPEPEPDVEEVRKIENERERERMREIMSVRRITSIPISS